MSKKSKIKSKKSRVITLDSEKIIKKIDDGKNKSDDLFNSKKCEEYKFIDMHQGLLQQVHSLNKELKELKRNINKFYSAYKQDIKKARKTGAKRKDSDKLSGFNGPNRIPDIMADFLGVEHGTCMSRSKLGSKFNKAFREKGLYYEKDKRIFRANDAVKKMFDVTDEINNVTDARDKTGLTIYTLQTFIAKCINLDKIKNHKSKSQ